jgi:hypothetical protein
LMVPELKEYLKEVGIPVRIEAPVA